MSSRGRKYREAAAKIDADKLYSRAEAVKLIKETAYTSFDPTVEVHLRLGVDPRHADQQVRDVIVLPNGLGKTVRVLVFAEGEEALAAEQAGADYIAVNISSPNTPGLRELQHTLGQVQAETLAWLLEEDDPGVRYLALRQRATTRTLAGDLFEALKDPKTYEASMRALEKIGIEDRKSGV